MLQAKIKFVSQSSPVSPTDSLLSAAIGAEVYFSYKNYTGLTFPEHRLSFGRVTSKQFWFSVIINDHLN